MKINTLITVLLILALYTVSAAPKVKHIVLIGCDGLGAYAYDSIKAPNINKIKERGSYTLKMRSVLPSSSAVNWASMLMGACPTFHGYTEWGSKTPEIPSITTSKYGKFPSIFTILREQKPKSISAVIHSWEGIKYLFEENIININIHGKEDDNLTSAIACDVIIRDKPTLTFIHFDEPDIIGHNEGHNTPGYFATVEEVDERIGMILETIKKADIEKETVVIITADHGGINKGHGGKSLSEIEIPFIIAGPGIKKNHNIQGTMIIYDVAPTIAKILKLKQPQSWRGKPIDNIFGK